MDNQKSEQPPEAKNVQKVSRNYFIFMTCLSYNKLPSNTIIVNKQSGIDTKKPYLNEQHQKQYTDTKYYSLLHIICLVMLSIATATTTIINTSIVGLQ
jgi:hypothetical protein